MALAGLAYLRMIYSELLSYDNGLLASNSDALGGMSAVQSIYHGLEVSTIEAYVVGIITGSFVAIILVKWGPNVLPRLSHALRGMLVGIVLGTIYSVAFIPIIGAILWTTTIAVSLTSGLIGGYLYSKFRI